MLGGKINMDKKGVSPLVATVMLVAVVVVIAFLVFWWYGDYVNSTLQKSEVTAEQACINDVSFDLSEPGCIQQGTNWIVYFNAENTGNAKVISFKANVDGNQGGTFVTIPQSIDRSVESKLSFNVETANVGNSLNVEVIPMVKAGGATKYCNNKAKSFSVACN